MNKSALFTLLLGFCWNLAIAQIQFQWAHALGSANTDLALGAFRDPSGNLYQGFMLSGPADLDPGPGVVHYAPQGKSDAVFVKYADNGAYQGYFALTDKKQVDHIYLYGSAQEDQGIRLCGAFMDSLWIRTPGKTTLLHAGQGYQTVMLLLDMQFNATSLRVFPSAQKMLPWYVSETLPGGDYLIAFGLEGTVQLNTLQQGPVTLSSLGENDLVIARMTAQHQIVWVLHSGSSAYDEPGPITILADNSVLASMKYTGTAHVQGQSVVGGNGSNWLFCKISMQGQLQWVHTLRFADQSGVSDVVAYPNGDWAVAGQFNKPSNFALLPGPTHMLDPGLVRACFIARYAANGSLRWAKAMPLSFLGGVRRLMSNPLGDTYMTGFYRGTIQLDQTTILSTPNTWVHLESFVTRFDAEGKLTWHTDISSVTGGVFLGDIVRGKHQQLVIQGTFGGVFDADRDAGEHLLTSKGLSDIVLLGYLEPGAVSLTFDRTPDPDGLKAWPSPASTVLRMSLEEPALAIRMIHASGAIQYEAAIPTGSLEHEVQVSHWPAGVYWLHVRTARGALVRSVMVQP